MVWYKMAAILLSVFNFQGLFQAQFLWKGKAAKIIVIKKVCKCW